MLPNSNIQVSNKQMFKMRTNAVKNLVDHDLISSDQTIFDRVEDQTRRTLRTGDARELSNSLRSSSLDLL